MKFNSTYILIFFLLCSCEHRFSKYAVTESDVASAYDISKARKFVDDNLKDHPESIDLAIQKLRLLREEGWPEGSNSHLERAISLDSSSFELLELGSYYFYEMNAFDKALSFGRQAEKHGASSAEFYQLKSSIYNSLGEYDQAIDYINKAILINRSDLKSYYTKGKIYLSFGDTISALKFMEIGLSHYRNNFKVLYEVSDIFEKTGQYQKAESLINEAISYAPENEDLTLKKVDIFKNQGKYGMAKTLLKESLDRNKDNINSGLRLGEIYMDSLKYDSVIHVMNKIVFYDSLNLPALHLRAKAYDKKGFYTSSIGNYTQILSLDSAYEDAKEEWIKVSAKRAYLQKLKEEQEAIPSFDFFVPKKKSTN